MCLQISLDYVYVLTIFVVLIGKRIDLNNSDDFVNNIYCLCSTFVFAGKIIFKFSNILQSIKLLHSTPFLSIYLRFLFE